MTADQVVQLSVFDDLSAARAVAQRHDVPLYRRTGDGDDLWACAHPADDAAAAEAAEHSRGRLAYGGRQRDGADTGAVLTALWFDAPEDSRDSFVDWFREEHGPLLLEEPAWLRIRQLRLDASSRPATHLVLHDLADPSAFSSPALARARETSARIRLAAQDWFANNVTMVFTREEAPS